MAFTINGIEVTNVTINNTPIDKLIIGGETVWEKTSPTETGYLKTEDSFYIVTENNEKLEV